MLGEGVRTQTCRARVHPLPVYTEPGVPGQKLLACGALRGNCVRLLTLCSRKGEGC